MNKKKTKIAYKGFDKDLKCRGFQYEVGKDYDLPEDPVLCESGFHACENPLDVLRYYPPCGVDGTHNRYCIVEQSGKMGVGDDKTASSHIHISAEIGLDGLIDAGVKSILDVARKSDRIATSAVDHSVATNTGDYSAATSAVDHSAATNTGDHSAATNTGNHSASTNTGDCSAATNTGYCSAATNTGYHSAATNTGDYSAATNTGDFSASTNTGDCSASTNTGNHSASTNTGNCSVATNTGDYSAAIVTGKESVAIVTGVNGRAKGTLGCWLVLTERDEWNGTSRPILGMKAVKVDGKKILPDTFYALENGKIVKQ